MIGICRVPLQNLSRGSSNLGSKPIYIDYLNTKNNELVCIHIILPVCITSEIMQVERNKTVFFLGYNVSFSIHRLHIIIAGGNLKT